MYKWLTIMGIVCIGFVVVLLSLGYLLKENKVAVTALKQKIEQEKTVNTSDENSIKAVLTFVDQEQKNADLLQQQKNIIVSNLTCVSSSQCTVVNLKRMELGCVVALNKIGASILEKSRYATSKDNDIDCETNANATSSCQQNICELVK